MTAQLTVGQTGIVVIQKLQLVSYSEIPGILSKRSVDNLSVGFHEDHGVGVPKSYVIEYYVGKTVPTAPKTLAL